MNKLEIIEVVSASEGEIVVAVRWHGDRFEMGFEQEELLESAAAYDEPWFYLFRSYNAPNDKVYELTAEFYGHPEYNMEFAQIEDGIELAED